MEEMALKLDYRGWVGFTHEEQIDKEEGSSRQWNNLSQVTLVYAWPMGRPFWHRDPKWSCINQLPE